ncbi:FtsX-like permease family protein [Salinispirillum sp. LH 10-3-1]|uniref:FtsX-like permease family protein n=1 Tax=Salinispirillum sp. LH 10-3-1 TaxID=2952525 RepID=A0AB38YCX8_9GAMM
MPRRMTSQFPAIKWLLFAWANLGRNRRRTVATLLLTAIGVLGMMSTSGFALYTYDSLREFSMRDQGHVILSHPLYFVEEEEYPLEFGLANHTDIKAQLRTDPRIRHVLANVRFNGLITNGDKSTIFVGEGVEPEIFQVRGPSMQLSAGRQLSLSPDPMGDYEILLGKQLAHSLRAEPGSGLTLMGTTADGLLNAIDVVVRGVVETGIPELDSRLVMAHLETAQDLLLTDKVGQLGVFLRDNNAADTMHLQLTRDLPELAVTPWHERATFYQSVRNLYNRIFGVMGIILLVMVGFAIFNTASMSVLERTREIGTLGAMGTRRREILSIFLNEAALIGLLGSAVGLLLSGLLTGSLFVFDVQMPPPPGQTEGYPLQVYWSPQIAAISTGLVTALAVCASAFATLRSVQKPITEALNHV